MFPFLPLVNCIFPFTYCKRSKEISLQTHSYARGVGNSSFPTNVNPLPAHWPDTSCIVHTWIELASGVRLESQNPTPCTKGSTNSYFNMMLILAGLTSECATEKGNLADIYWSLRYFFLVLNLQNSGTRKCLQKVFEEVTERSMAQCCFIYG